MKGDTIMTVEQRRENLEKEIKRLDVYENLRNELMAKIQWSYMKYHTSDDEHDESWFTEPEDGDYNYDSYNIAMEIIGALDKYMKL